MRGLEGLVQRSRGSSSRGATWHDNNNAYEREIDAREKKALGGYYSDTDPFGDDEEARWPAYSL